MAKYLTDIAANIHADADWHSNKTSGFVKPPASTISDIVGRKSTLAKSYDKMDEMWLLIASSGRPSEMILPIQGVEEFHNDTELRHTLEGSLFSRVYTDSPMGLFEWCRLSGWRNVPRGKHVENEVAFGQAATHSNLP